MITENTRADGLMDLNDTQIDDVSGGLLPIIIPFVAGAAFGAGVYLLTEYLT